MPSARHQSLVRLVTEGRGVLRAVLAFVGLDVPEALQLHPGPDAIRDGGRWDYFPDGSMVAQGTTHAHAHAAFVVEVQLGEKASKRYTWPLYVTIVRNRLRCRTTLIVFTDSEDVETWASQPIEIGEGMVMHPVVIGPARIPIDLSRAQAREVPALAVLAVVAHGRGPGAKRIGQLALDAITPLMDEGDERAILYMDVIYAYLDKTVLTEILEDEMSLVYQPISPYFKRKFAEATAEGLTKGIAEGRAKGIAEGRAEGMTEGRAKGMARMLERLLDQRGLVVSIEQRRTMAACQDEVQLQRWFDRAITATSVAVILAD